MKGKLILIILIFSNLPLGSNYPPVDVIITNTSLTGWDLITYEMGLDWLHDQGYNGTGIKVGFIDNGIDFLHEAFSEKTFSEQSFAPPANESTQTHGTPVAGVVVGYTAQNISGSAPGAEILSAEMGSDPTDVVIVGNFTAAIEWLALNDVDVINTSFGGMEDWDPIIEIARQNNIVIVGSAGNDGVNFPPSGPGSETYSIGVGAITANNNTEFYSSEGPTSEYFQKPDVTAYGTIETLNVILGTGFYTGTSFSSPLVAGGIASVLSGLKSLGKTWTVGGVKSALLQASRKIQGTTQSQGAGLTNFTEMFHILNDNLNLGRIFHKEFIPEYQVLPSGLITELPVQMIVSDYSSTNIVVSGNMTDLVSMDPIDAYTTLPLTINTTGKNGVFGMDVDLFVNGELVDSSNLLIEVGDQIRGIVGVDYYHSDTYTIGQENLLNTNNLAKDLRDNWFWPVYITDELDEVTLNNIDILLMKEVFTYRYDNTISQDQISLIKEFVINGGHVILLIESPEFIDDQIIGSNLEEVNKLTNEFGIQIDGNLGNQILTRASSLKNESMFAQRFDLISHHGFNITGGKSFFEGNFRGIAYNDSFDGKVLVSSSLNFLDNRGFTLDLISWLSDDIFYKFQSIDRIDDRVEITFSGGDQFDKANIYRYDYSKQLIGFETILIEVQPIKSLEFQLQSGIYEIVVQSSSSPAYLKVSGDIKLVYDNIVPELNVVIVANVSDMLLNETAGEEWDWVVIEYSDNHLVEGFEILVNDQTRTYEHYTHDQIRFVISSTDFGDYLHLNVTVTATDPSGNSKTIIVRIEREIVLIPVGVIERVPVRIDKVTEGLTIDYSGYVFRMTMIIVSVLALASIAVYMEKRTS